MSKIILSIDDSQSIQKFILSTLAPAGHEVILANDGVEGMERIGKENVDLILLDLIMPRMNGFHVLREINRSSDFAQIPIIVISSDKRQQCIDEATGLGAKKFLCKPFKPEELLEAVSEMLKNILSPVNDLTA